MWTGVGTAIIAGALWLVGCEDLAYAVAHPGPEPKTIYYYGPDPRVPPIACREGVGCE